MSVPEQLERILSSREFRESQRMCRFLRFVVERALNGEASTLKEYLIGVEVFDRREGYDPRVDPIVRVEARRLRSKLKTYYSGAGNLDPVVIELPTGTYSPIIRGIEAAQPAPVAAITASRDRTIAVLPFTNLTLDPESEYFSDGLTEELTHVLTKVPGLQVVSWTSTAQMKGAAPDPAAVAEQLAADVFVRGSVRAARGRMRIMAQLVEAPRGLVLWSESFDRQIEDIFAIQDEIATAIAHALQLRLIDKPRSEPSLEVYDLYLRGRYHWNSRSPEGLQQSVECFRQAIALDPGYALAHAGLADAWTILIDYGALAPSDIDRAEEAALKAIELDPTLAEPFATLAMIRSIHWKWSEVEQLYQRSLALNPNYSTAHHWLGIDYLAIHGWFPEALTELEIAARLDPLSAIIMEGRAMLFMMWGRFAESQAAYEALCRRVPGSPKLLAGLGRLHIQMGQYDRACDLLENAHAKDPNTPSVLGALGMAHALADRSEAARERLRCLEALALTRYVPATSRAMVHVGLGEHARALDWLEKAAAQFTPSLMMLGVHPAYDPLRSEPRFRALIERAGFVDAEKRAASYRKAAQ
jgi:TolB-like protein/Tfp pilus assembly protein PilF